MSRMTRERKRTASTKTRTARRAAAVDHTVTTDDIAKTTSVSGQRVLGAASSLPERASSVKLLLGTPSQIAKRSARRSALGNALRRADGARCSRGGEDEHRRDVAEAAAAGCHARPRRPMRLRAETPWPQRGLAPRQSGGSHACLAPERGASRQEQQHGCEPPAGPAHRRRPHRGGRVPRRRRLL